MDFALVDLFFVDFVCDTTLAILGILVSLAVLGGELPEPWGKASA